MISSPRIVQQTEHFVFVEKPALWLSVPGRFAEDPRPIVGTTLQTNLGKKIYPVHRLDFEVSGLMMFALTAEGHRRASQLFEKQQIQKSYLAQTDPIQEPWDGVQVWKRKILRGKKRAYESPHGELAITEAEILSQQGQWRLSPRTGKSHQLRVEMSLRGYPIHGDSLYGSQVIWSEPGIALRAVSLRFPPEFSEWAALPDLISIS